MATVTLDTLAECRGRRTSVGWEWERGAVVTDIAPTSPWSLCAEAAVATGMPAIGDEWPGNDGSFLEEIIPTAISATQVRFRLVYRVPVGELNVWHVELSGSLASVETNKDVNGDTVSVSYTWPTSTSDANYPHEHPELAGQTRTVSDLRSVMRPETVLIASRRTIEFDPIAATQALMGHTNVDAWHGGSAGQWLCEGCSFVSEIYGGNVWNQRVQLRLRDYTSDGWKSTATFVDRNTGYPPSDVQFGTGIKLVTDYPAANYATLLPLL